MSKSCPNQTQVLIPFLGATAQMFLRSPAPPQWWTGQIRGLRGQRWLPCRVLMPPVQWEKLNFWGTRPKTDVPYMFYTKFHSPGPIFCLPSLKCTCIAERACVSFLHCSPQRTKADTTAAATCDDELRFEGHRQKDKAHGCSGKALMKMTKH